MFESCAEIGAYLSQFADGECSRDVYRSVRYHLGYCVSCRQELETLQTMLGDLRSIPRLRPSEEVALRVRVQISREVHRNALGRMRVRIENFLQPLLIPVSGGVLATVVLVGLLVGSIVPRATHTPDVSLQFSTPPRIERMGPLDFGADSSVVVMTRVSAEGRVVDYSILSGRRSPELVHHLDRLMFFSVFSPATLFGEPTSGEVVLSLRRVTVRG